SLREESFKPAPKKSIVLRMINNLIGVVSGDDGMKTEALPYLNLILEIDPGSWRQRGQRAMIRMRAKDVDGARDDLRNILDNPPSEMDEEQVQQLRHLFQNLGEAQ
ncbi:MAG: hypothetical protein JWO08_826, partial [Verrucomicrobiaceae bacterium]|nr:hypothetical protein [Verrucomicrobiaceae bacterium]